MVRNGSSPAWSSQPARPEPQSRGSRLVQPECNVDRFYRAWGGRSIPRSFEVTIEQSNLLVVCDEPLEREARSSLACARQQVERAIRERPAFATSLAPLDTLDHDAPLARAMCDGARAWDVGPMAAVAGVIAEHVGKELLRRCATVIVENGGDIFARADEPLLFGLYAGAASPFCDRLAFSVDARDGIAVCTSSGTVGPSLSFGRADAVVAIATDGAWADAAATSIANRIATPDDVVKVVEDERERGALLGLIACCGDRLGAWGNVALRRR